MHRSHRWWPILICLMMTLLSAQTPVVVKNDPLAVITSAGKQLSVQWYADDVVRLERTDIGAVSNSSLAVVQVPDKKIVLSVVRNDTAMMIRSEALIVRVDLVTLSWSVSDVSGKTFFASVTTANERIVRFPIAADDHFYGTGERGTALDKKGQRFLNYNTQSGGYDTPLPTMNLNVPFLASTRGAGLFFDTPWRGTFDVGATDPNVLSYTAEGGTIPVFVIAGTTIAKQVERYTWLTGRQPLPPSWAFGFIQSKNRYKTAQEARAVVTTMRAKGIPCDALVLDLAWFKDMGDIAWDTVAFPDHERMIKEFLGERMKTILITEPYVVRSSRSFTVADSLGYFAKDSAGKTYILDRWWSCGGCDAALLDMTNPAARSWWWSLHPSAFGNDVAGIWTDLGEPEKHPDGMMHLTGPAMKVHNISNHLWAETIFNGFSSLHPGRRVFNLSRSGYAGTQRYGVIPWSGDVARKFGGLAVQLPMMLNMGMSGYGYHNSDAGGYARNATTPELYVRWLQFASFSPVMRAHGAGENVSGSPTEPWMFGAEAESIVTKYIRLRYALLPYNYSLAHQNNLTGEPLARPVWWHTGIPDAAANESGSYLWGDAILVSPVTAAQESVKTVRLPEGEWFDYWTDRKMEGGKTISVPAPLSTLPLFVRAGSIIPMLTPRQTTDERPWDTLIVHVYPPTAEGKTGAFTLYEDDGITTEYQSGRSAVTEFTVKRESGKGKNGLFVTIGPASGNFEGQMQKRIYRLFVHGIASLPKSVTVAGRGCRVVANDMEMLGRSDVVSFKKEKKLLTIQFVASSSEGAHVTIDQHQ